MKVNLGKLIGLILGLTLITSPVWAVDYKTLQPVELKSMLADKNFFLLDVHVPEQAHIPGTNALIHFRKIKENVSSLPVDKDTKIVVYCHMGGMSRLAARHLIELGYTHVYDLAGGSYAFFRLPD